MRQRNAFLCILLILALVVTVGACKKKPAETPPDTTAADTAPPPPHVLMIGDEAEGHCDERGTIEYNLALGERRASSVRDYLTSLGVARNRIRVITYGEERPVDPGHTEAAWSKNRRAQFVAE